MGCGCGGGGGGRRPVTAPKLPHGTGKITENIGKLHPSVLHMQNIRKLADERRKVETLRREQLLRALSKP